MGQVQEAVRRGFRTVQVECLVLAPTGPWALKSGLKYARAALASLGPGLKGIGRKLELRRTKSAESAEFAANGQMPLYVRCACKFMDLTPGGSKDQRTGLCFRTQGTPRWNRMSRKTPTGPVLRVANPTEVGPDQCGGLEHVPPVRSLYLYSEAPNASGAVRPFDSLIFRHVRWRSKLRAWESQSEGRGTTKGPR